jgi:hypothetical protein
VALNVATGEVFARRTRRHCAPDFAAFVRKPEASVEPGWR